MSAEPLRHTSSIEDRLRFLVDFAGVDLDKARPGDWLNLRSDLRVVLGSGKKGAAQGHDISALGGIIPIARNFEALDSDDVLRSLQAEVRAIVNTVAGRSEPAKRPSQSSRIDNEPSSGAPVSRAITLSLRKSLVVTDPRLGIVPMIEGDARDVLLEMLFAILSRERLAPIRRCPVCGKAFYRVRGQKFCSRACSNIQSQRTWLAKPQNARKKQAADRKRRARRERERRAAARRKRLEG